MIASAAIATISAKTALEMRGAPAAVPAFGGSGARTRSTASGPSVRVEDIDVQGALRARRVVAPGQGPWNIQWTRGGSNPRRGAGLAVGSEEPGPEGEADQLGAMVEPELHHDARAVRVDRLRADEELLADLARAEPLGRIAQDLALAFGQLLERVGL